MASSHGNASHASTALYWYFAVILCVITFFEWGIVHWKSSLGLSSGILFAALIVMSLVKFVMVVGWYMHLRYDNSTLKSTFVFSLVLATATVLALAVLMVSHGYLPATAS